MLRQRVCAGIKQACKFQREVYPSKETSALIKIKKGHRFEFESVFDNVFRECILSSRKQREGLYKRLLGMFERSEEPKSSPSNDKNSAKKKGRSRRSSFAFEEPEIEADISLLSFAAQVLAYLPYNSYGDPLFIQHHITSIVALQGPQLQEKMAVFLRPYGLASADEFDDMNAEEDLLEIANKSASPSRSKEAEPLNRENFDWPGFIELCREASSLALLLRLKAFLRKRYNLSEARCLEYNPDSHDRAFSRSIVSRAENIPPFDASVATVSPSNPIHGDEERDRLIHFYSAFRQLMREEVKADEEAIDMIDPDLEIAMADESLIELSDENERGENDVEDGYTERGKGRSSTGGRKRKSSFGGSGKKKRKSVDP